MDVFTTYGAFVASGGYNGFLQYLGLLKAISGVLGKIAGCHKCATFWTTLFVFTVLGVNAFITIGLSILAAYLSYWFEIILNLLGLLWHKANNRQEGR